MHCRLTFLTLFILFFLTANSCPAEQDFRANKVEVGSLLWIENSHSDEEVKNAVRVAIENSTIIVAQVSWEPSCKTFMSNIDWYHELARSHNRSFMINIDWQSLDRSDSLSRFRFSNPSDKSLFMKAVITAVEKYRPDYLTLGVEVNYYALTNPRRLPLFFRVIL